MSRYFHILDEFKPYMCRLLAVRYPTSEERCWPVALSEEQIRAISGLPLADIRYLSLMESWDDVPLLKIKAFIKGCRLNFGNYRALDRIRRMARRGEFSHARTSPYWDSQLREIHEIWKKSQPHSVP